MSDNRREKTILEQVESAELLLQKLKEKVISDNGNDVAVVNAIYNEGSLLSKQIEDLLHDTAPQKADEVFSALISFLDDNYDDMPRDTLWDTFRDKLKLFEGTCLEFRKECLTRDTVSFRGNDNWNIFHVVCRLNPPVDIIKTLIDITPPENPHYFNHLACTPSPDDHIMYPLHVVAKCGGTLDVVKLLVDIDKEKNALKFEKGTSALHAGKSAIHVLIHYRKKHHPQVFSEILRYLVLSIDDFGGSALKQSAMPKYDWALPVSQLWYNMILKEKKCGHEIIQNNDFIFLLKATCYHHLFACIRRWTCNDMTKLNESERARQIEDMSLSKAFTICLHCFTARYDTTGDTLRDLLSSDSKFLEDRDEKGNYPIHNMIIDSSYFWGSAGSRDNLFLIIPSILEAVPKCARQLDNEGRLPLHIAADLQNLMPHGMREKLVRAIWKAYPKAATVPDKKTGLLPFALAARSSNEGYDFNTVLDSRLENDDSLTSSFFLLRQYPEIISEYNVFSGSEDKAPKLPAKRKHEEHCNSE